MFFFIGGITPKTKRLDNRPVRCPNCGLHQAYRARVDHWLHLFFIPVVPVKRGKEFLYCEHCDRQTGPWGEGTEIEAPSQAKCPSCGSSVEKHFRFCPKCGRRL